MSHRPHTGRFTPRVSPFCPPRAPPLAGQCILYAPVWREGDSTMRKTCTLIAIALLSACSHQESATQSQSDASFESKLQQQLLDAKPGSVIAIPAGHYTLKRGLSLRTNGVTIRGEGMDK